MQLLADKSETVVPNSAGLSQDQWDNALKAYTCVIISAADRPKQYNVTSALKQFPEAEMALTFGTFVEHAIETLRVVGGLDPIAATAAIAHAEKLGIVGRIEQDNGVVLIALVSKDAPPRDRYDAKRQARSIARDTGVWKQLIAA